MWWIFALLGCKPGAELVPDLGVDADEDGAPLALDCDDENPGRSPGAVEICNGIDDDCNGEVDEGLLRTFFVDVDQDGYGDEAQTLDGCTPDSGWTSTAGDCADDDATLHPGAIEVCDGIDQDCDGDVDEELLVTVFADLDGDGWGVGSATVACPGVDLALVDGDCDDQNPYRHPGAIEVCDGVDQDCDTETDEELLVASYADADGDGFGDGAATEGCPGLEDRASVDGDCDDDDATRYPGALETCDGIDQDCNDTPDDGLLVSSYEDEDGDGFGDGAAGLTCPGEKHRAELDGDCEDDDETRYPGALEICDGIDQDCDDEVDEGLQLIVYRDDDQDGYGDGAALLVCVVEDDHAKVDGDCDDGDPEVHPGAVELCDDVDRDCDGSATAGAKDLSRYFADQDGDTWGTDSDVREVCEVDRGVGYVERSGDCDDDDLAVHPGATEWCAPGDSNCDGDPDEGAVDPDVYYVDADGDGYGIAAGRVEACTHPGVGHAIDKGDCNDNNELMSPAEPEHCDGIDNDCDKDIDEDDADDASTWYIDGDADGAGDPKTASVQCLAPARGVENGDDCDDQAPAVHPAAIEVCNDIDDDCNQQIDDEDPAVDPATQGRWYLDDDGDEFGLDADWVLACDASGRTVVPGDCDDALDTSFPGADENCNEVDDDCNGLIDDDPLDGEVYFRDADGDGFGDLEASVFACEPLAGHVEDTSDCNDTDPDVNPLTAWYVDDDWDGFGDPMTEPFFGCETPPFTSLAPNDDDCDDSDTWIAPDIIEECNDGVDNDCDAEIDEGYTLYGEDYTCHARSFCGDVNDAVVIAATDDAVIPAYCTANFNTSLTLDPGATLWMEVGSRVRMMGTSTLTALGTSDAPIRFTSGERNPVPGDHSGLYIASGATADLAYVTLEHGGRSNVTALWIYGKATLDHVTVRDNLNVGIGLWENVRPTITNSDILDNGSYGLYCWGSTIFKADCLDHTDPSKFTGNLITGNFEPMMIPAVSVPAVDPLGNDLEGNTYDRIRVGPNAQVWRDTIWPKNSVPYYLPPAGTNQSSGVVWNNAKLTIEPGVEIIASSNTLIAGGSTAGTLVAVGTEAEPIRMRGYKSGPGVWHGLRIDPTSTASTRVEQVWISDAGQSDGCVQVNGDKDLLVLKDSLVENCLHSGVRLYAGALATVQGTTVRDVFASTSFTTPVASVRVERSSTATSYLSAAFQDNVVEDFDGYALVLPATSVNLLRESSTFDADTSTEDTDEGEIYVYEEQYKTSSRIRRMNVPYLWEDDLLIGDNTNAPVLTIDPGVEIAFPSNGLVNLNAKGDIAAGALDGDPVVLRALDDFSRWEGVYVGGGSGVGTSFKNVEVHRGGQVEAAFRVYGKAKLDTVSVLDSSSIGILSNADGQNGRLWLSNSTVTGSALEGVVARQPSSIQAWSANTLTDNQYPARLPFEALVLLDGLNSTYQPNEASCVVVNYSLTAINGTIPKLDVPYLAWDSLRLYDYDNLPGNFVIEPGVAFRMGPGTAFTMSGDVTLLADGVTWTSWRSLDPLEGFDADCNQPLGEEEQDSQPGDWAYLGLETNKTVTIRNSTVEWGGAVWGVVTWSGKCVGDCETVNYDVPWWYGTYAQPPAQLYRKGAVKVVGFEGTWGTGNVVRGSETAGFGCHQQNGWKSDTAGLFATTFGTSNERNLLGNLSEGCPKP